MTSDATNTPEHANLKAELEARLQFETLLAGVSATLINPTKRGDLWVANYRS